MKHQGMHSLLSIKRHQTNMDKTIHPVEDDNISVEEPVEASSKPLSPIVSCWTSVYAAHGNFTSGGGVNF
jgi:hypothetical protein